MTSYAKRYPITNPEALPKPKDRPKCHGCGKPLAPRWSVTFPRTLGEVGSRTFTGLYGHYLCGGFFCTLACAKRLGVAMAQRGWQIDPQDPRPVVKAATP